MNPYTNFDTCSSKHNLYSVLRAFDITVPLRSEGRTKLHIERWIVCRLLASLSASDQLLYPVSLKHGDRPDFYLSTSNGDIGFEVTEALLENYAEYRKLAEREYPEAMLEPGHFREGKVPFSKMKERLARKKLSSLPWMGNSLERRWAQEMARVIENKLKKLKAPEFKKFQTNWLGIDDNLPRSSLELDDAVSILVPLIAPLWGKPAYFNNIFIDHGSIIVCLTRDRQTLIQVNDLWYDRHIRD